MLLLVLGLGEEVKRRVTTSPNPNPSLLLPSKPVSAAACDPRRVSPRKELRKFLHNFDNSPSSSCIMSTSHSKVVVDHEGDRSSSQKPVLLLGFRFLETDLLLELDDLVQSRSNSSRPASQILENSFQKRIARTSISSNESTISTSLIHNIASDGYSEVT